MNDDCVLLRRYAEEGSESAFTELVRRHVDLVYGAALRRTNGDTHRAADVAQQVFTTLARKAKKLSRHAVLGAWLHTATRNAALNLMISEQRRQARELKALALDPAFTTGAASPDWERLRPVLDTAIDELPEADRSALVLRFLERRPFAEVGAALQVSEDAARMRTDRALDKLRVVLARRGITSTAAALGAIVSTQPVISAPAGLAAALAAQSLATAGAGAGLLAMLASFMSLKTIATAALGALVFFGAGFFVGVTRNLDAPLPPLPETPRQTELIAALRGDNRSLRAEIDRLAALNSSLSARRTVVPPPAPAPATAAPTMSVGAQQRAILNNLRQISAARDYFQLENRRPPTSLDELVGETKLIKRLIPIDGEDYAMLSMLPDQALIVTAINGGPVAYDPSGVIKTPLAPLTAAEQAARDAKELADRRADELRLRSSYQKALAAYKVANNGGNPPTRQALLPYFATPQDGADFAEMSESDVQKIHSGP